MPIFSTAGVPSSRIAGATHEQVMSPCSKGSESVNAHRFFSSRTTLGSGTILKRHPVTNLALRAEGWGGDELLDENPAVGLDDPARGHVVRVGGDLDEPKTLRPSFRQQL